MSKTIHEDAFVHESSYVDENVAIGSGSKIWHFSHVLINCDIVSSLFNNKIFN